MKKLFLLLILLMSLIVVLEVFADIPEFDVKLLIIPLIGLFILLVIKRNKKRKRHNATPKNRDKLMTRKDRPNLGY